MKNDQNKTWKVYIHTAPNGDVYVGVTGQDVKLRWKPSLYRGLSLYPYIEQYGWKNIKHEVIYTCEDRDEAYQVEEEMRQYYTEKGCCINKKRSGLVRVKDVKAYDRQLRKDNPVYREKQNERCRQWVKNKYANDPEYRDKMIEKARQYRQNHKEEKAAYDHQYYLKKKAEKLLQDGQIEIPLAS